MAGPPGRIRILVADDHPVVRDGLKALLGTVAGFEVVAEAGDGRAAVAAHRTHAPDITLMDLRMPLLDGADAIAAILRISPGARIIVITTFDGDEDIHRALRNGARGYLLKDASRDEILFAIRSVHAGGRHISPEAAATLAARPIGQDLTPREIEVLELIAKGQSNREIGGELGIAEGTVKTHVNGILVKLGADDRTEAVLLGLKRGILRLD